MVRTLDPTPFETSRPGDPAVFALYRQLPIGRRFETLLGGTGGVNSSSSTDHWQLSQNPLYGSLMVWCRASNSQNPTGAIVRGGGVSSWDEICNFRHGGISSSTETGVQIGFVGAVRCSGFFMTGTAAAGAHLTVEYRNWDGWSGTVEVETAPLTRTTAGTLTASLFGRRPGLLLVVGTDLSSAPTLSSTSQGLTASLSTSGSRGMSIWHALYQANTAFSATVSYVGTRAGLYAAVIR